MQLSFELCIVWPCFVGHSYWPAFHYEGHDGLWAMGLNTGGGVAVTGRAGLAETMSGTVCGRTAAI